MPPSQLQSVDRLSALLERFRVRAHLFHAGPLCGVTQYDAQAGRGFLHVLRRGEMVVTHRPRSGIKRVIKVTEPTLLFYPRPIEHAFHNAPDEGADFICATVDFEGGDRHPLVAALPPILVLPLHAVPELEQTLALLFAETSRVLCGQRLLADRLFEVLLLQLLRWTLDHPDQMGNRAGLIFGLAHPKLARLLTALHEEPGEPWALERMAEVAGMSRSAFAAEFKSQLGTTPAQYLLNWRVSLAQSMLVAGESITRVSDKLGYAGAASFARAFAQSVGSSPTAWLRKRRGL